MSNFQVGSFLFSFFGFVFQNKIKTILYASLSIAVSLIITLLFEPSYSAKTSIFPVSSSQNSASALAQYSNLASMAGINIGSGATSDPLKVVGALLTSRLLVEEVVDKENLLNDPLMQALDLDEEKDLELRKRLLVRYLIDNISIDNTSDPNGVVFISYKSTDPVFSARIANSLASCLADLLKQKSMITSKKNRESLLSQISEQKEKLQVAQQKMANFQKRTSIFSPNQSAQSLEYLTTLIQQKMEAELKIQSARSAYSSNNPALTLMENQLKNIEQQISQFKTQTNGDFPSLKSAPDNLVEYQNLEAELELSTKIYISLIGSLEQNNISEGNDEIFIEIIDKALPPLEGFPSKFVILLSMIFFFAILYILSFVIWMNRDSIKRSISNISTAK